MRLLGRVFAADGRLPVACLLVQWWPPEPCGQSAPADETPWRSRKFSGDPGLVAEAVLLWPQCCRLPLRRAVSKASEVRARWCLRRDVVGGLVGWSFASVADEFPKARLPGGGIID